MKPTEGSGEGEGDGGARLKRRVLLNVGVVEY